MATKEEEIQKDAWWLNELESLGVSPKVKNELNDIQETSNLAENLKRAFYLKSDSSDLGLRFLDQNSAL
jgi:hypothetical protein